MPTTSGHAGWPTSGRRSSWPICIGIPVRYEPIEIDAFADALLAQGRSPFLVQHLSNVAQDYRDGVFSGTNNLVEVISGTPATTVEQFTAVNRAVFERDH
jgi:hypothetical protein